MPAPQQIFEPALFSLPENRFLLDWAGKPPIVALHKAPPQGVNPNAVRPILTAIYDLHELQTHQGVAWAGAEVVKDSIVRYLSWMERTMEIHRRGGPRHASMFGWDERGRTFKFAAGSDSGIVGSEIIADGSHVPFRVNLLQPHGDSGPSVAEVAPWLKQVDFEAKAKMESASLLAEAEVARAKGVAQANQIIGESLKNNDAYLRYLWITEVAGKDVDKTVVYIPTEANLPLLEAGRTTRIK